MADVLPAPRSLALAIIPLGVVVAIGNAVLLALFQVERRLPDIVQASATAFVIAEGSLVAIWIAFGNRPLPVRMVFAVPAIVVTFLPHSTGPYGVYAFAVGMILVVGASLPSLMFRIIGWRLARLSAGPATNPPVSQNPAQFSLGQMFGWTLAVAMVAGLVRILLRPEDLSPGMIVDLLANGGICLFFGAIASATVWAAFNPRRPLLRLLAVVVVTGVLPLSILWTLRANGQGIFMIVSLIVLDACFTGCALLLFRPVGIRLVRCKPKTQPTPTN